MKDYSNCKRQFTQMSRAWYGKDNLLNRDIIDSITMGFYHNQGGTTGEFSIVWEYLSGMVVSRLSVYDDAWDALYQFRDVLEKMAALDDKQARPEEICKLLVSCGVEDRTPTDNPFDRIIKVEQEFRAQEQEKDAMRQMGSIQ